MKEGEVETGSIDKPFVSYIVKKGAEKRGWYLEGGVKSREVNIL